QAREPLRALQLLLGRLERRGPLGRETLQLVRFDRRAVEQPANLERHGQVSAGRLQHAALRLVELPGAPGDQERAERPVAGAQRETGETGLSGVPSSVPGSDGRGSASLGGAEVKGPRPRAAEAVAVSVLWI